VILNISLVIYSRTTNNFKVRESNRNETKTFLHLVWRWKTRKRRAFTIHSIS